MAAPGDESDGRARNRLATRERLFQAAVTVIMTRGYDSATMEDIAAEAGVARRTAFNHFAAKSDIAVEWALRRGRAGMALVRNDRDLMASVPDRVRGYFHRLALMTERDWAETREMMTGWFRGYGSPSHRRWLSGELRKWLDEWLDSRPKDRLSKAAVDSALAAEVLFDVYQGVLLRWMAAQAPPARGLFTAEVDAVVDMVLAGLGQEASAE